MERTLARARELLLAARTEDGHWQGHLSSSALSTATAAVALDAFGRAGCGGAGHLAMAERARAWLAAHQNDDGSWGDTVASPGNISTTTLCWAALEAARSPVASRQQAIDLAIGRARSWLRDRAGDLDAEHLARAIGAVYGKDRTFAVPILTHGALCGRFGEGAAAWREIPALPFELAALPRGWLNRLGLGVVSYALPALIAIGLARHHHRPPRNPLSRLARHLARGTVLRLLRSIQPTSGGFLEAAPLTSFVLMSLVSIGEGGGAVARAAAAFLAGTVREDGSWPIDTDLAIWVTTLSLDALAGSPRNAAALTDAERATLASWILERQQRAVHPYTRAAPGGWAWTDRSGGVPDADDTAGALLALRRLERDAASSTRHASDLRQRVADGVRWLLDLQNRDGGLPTFCRGWGKLPFDRSSPDLTAHAVRAWGAWRDELPEALRSRAEVSLRRALAYLCATQREDGAWVPLWFGNQQASEKHNPLYGTARVVRIGSLLQLDTAPARTWRTAWRDGIGWLLAAQAAGGGWGATASVSASVEETALAVDALAGVLRDPFLPDDIRTRSSEAARRGAAWLVATTDSGRRFPSAPIGLYFASLWYDERLYPLIFTTAALARALDAWDGSTGR